MEMKRNPFSDFTDSLKCIKFFALCNLDFKKTANSLVSLTEAVRDTRNNKRFLCGISIDLSSIDLSLTFIFNTSTENIGFPDM